MSGSRERGVAAFASTVMSAAPGRGWLAIVLAVAVGLTEGIGVLLLLPLLSLAGVTTGTGTGARLSEAVGAAFARLGIPVTPAAVLVAYVAVMTAQALLQRWYTVTATGLEHAAVHRLRTRLYSAIVHARWLYVARLRGSDLTHALTTELARVGGAIYQLLLLVGHVVLGAVYFAVALRLSPAMSAVLAICGAILLLPVRARARRAKALGQELTVATAGLFATIADHLAGLKSTKGHGAEARSAALFTDRSAGVARLHDDAMRAHADLRLAFAVGAVITLAVVLWIAIGPLALAAAEILLLLYLFGRLVPRLASAQQSWQELVHELPAFDSLIRCTEEAERAAEPASSGGRSSVPSLANGVRLEQVGFAYDGAAGSPVIEGLDLEIPAHRTTAIVGPSGVGKTTIADLVMGLVTPTGGRVLVDGQALDEGKLHGWRERIGYVPQESLLFHDSIRANLLWARPDASEAQLWEALGRAAAADFVRRMPQGLDTAVGDRGLRLSGGERQRIALARALLRDPALLVLDEATSALDAGNEARVRDAIESLHGAVTLLVITHRLTSVRRADRIHVLAPGGRIEESGSWDELMANDDGAFRALCRAQGLAMDREGQVGITPGSA